MMIIAGVLIVLALAAWYWFSKAKSEGFDVPATSTDCVLSEWKDISTCSKKCGGGSKKSVRNIITAAEGNGKACGPLLQITPCNTEAC